MDEVEQLFLNRILVIEDANKLGKMIDSEDVRPAFVLLGTPAVLIEAINTLITRERLDELDNIPWKKTPKYGINTPYVTKVWLRERKLELQSSTPIGDYEADRKKSKAHVTQEPAITDGSLPVDYSTPKEGEKK